jgi:tetratricopeptide (TPR) repeat protein
MATKGYCCHKVVNRMLSTVNSSARPASLVVLRFLLVSTFLAANACAQGRTGSVSVRVSDEKDELPIPQADVRLYVFGQGNFSHQAYVDAGGRVTFLVVTIGSYTVTVQHLDYESGEERIDVAFGRTSEVLIRLQRKGTAPRPTVPGAISAASLAVPPDARKEFDAGSALLSANPGESISHFEKAVQHYQKYAEAYLMMGLAFLKVNRRAEALKAAAKAIEADPKFSKAYTFQGRLLFEDRDFQKAEASLMDAHFELARCYYNTGDIGKALDHALQARDMPQSNPITHLLLADIYLKQAQKKEALAELEAFAKAEPASPMLPRVQQKIAALRAKP